MQEMNYTPAVTILNNPDQYPDHAVEAAKNNNGGFMACIAWCKEGSFHGAQMVRTPNKGEKL